MRLKQLLSGTRHQLSGEDKKNLILEIKEIDFGEKRGRLHCEPPSFLIKKSFSPAEFQSEVSQDEIGETENCRLKSYNNSISEKFHKTDGSTRLFSHASSHNIGS